MAEFDFDTLMLEKIVDQSILVWANILHQESLKKVPRNWDNAPKPIILKRKKKPERNIRRWNRRYYRKPVFKNWHWYEWVTWNLKRSVWLESTSYLEYSVWVMEGPTEWQARTHEFWDPGRNIPKRSFLNEPLQKNQKLINNQIQKTFNELLDKYK